MQVRRNHAPALVRQTAGTGGAGRTPIFALARWRWSSFWSASRALKAWRMRSKPTARTRNGAALNSLMKVFMTASLAPEKEPAVSGEHARIGMDMAADVEYGFVHGHLDLPLLRT